MTQSNPSSRRSFLKAGTIAAVTALPLSACAQPVERPVPAAPADPWRGLKVGVATYSFRKIPLDATIQGIQRVDLHYCSIKEAHLPLNSTTEQRKQVSQAFRDARITPLSCGNITIRNEAMARQAFEYARDIGVPTIVCAPDPDTLPMLDKMVKEFDIKLAIHNHGPEAPHFKTPTEVWEAIQTVDPRIGLCIDVGHTFRGGDDPAADIRKYKSRFYDCHMKDVSDRRGKSARVEVEVGRGVMDIPGILAALLEVKFAGHVGFEHEKTAESPLPGLAESVGYTKGVLRMM
ncbi:MAG TPA: sugar phosphate isomerase/epimerase [Tepidisphaeraceae bacterium]